MFAAGNYEKIQQVWPVCSHECIGDQVDTLHTWVGHQNTYTQRPMQMLEVVYAQECPGQLQNQEGHFGFVQMDCTH